jgi:hypothetical protein
VFTAPCSYLVDFLFTEILHAPTTDTHESNIMKAGRRVSATARRISKAGLAASARMMAAVEKTRTSFIDKGRQRVATMMHVDITLVAPDATVEAHREATISVEKKLDKIKSENMDFEKLRISKRQNASSQRFIAVHRDSSVLNIASVHKGDEKLMTVDEMSYAKFYEFDEDFHAQRSGLDEHDRKQLDRIWEYAIYIE